MATNNIDWPLNGFILGAVAATVALAFNPVFLSTLRHVALYVVGLLWRRKGRCRRVTRQDLTSRAEKSLHICSVWDKPAPPRYAHVNTTKAEAPHCPHSLPSKFFTDQADVPEVYRQKPHFLDFSKDYLKMEVWTLAAYLLHWHDRFDAQDLISKPRLELYEVTGKTLVAHVIAERPTLPEKCWPMICQLSCNDVDGLLKGYPPFYRRKLETPSGDDVDHPIESAADIARGGWIAAIGLCKPLILGKHRMRDPQLTPRERLPHLLHVVQPFARIQLALQNFAKAFPSKDMSRVIKMAKAIRTRDRSSASSSEDWFWESPVMRLFKKEQIESQSYLRNLTQLEIRTALGAFNHYGYLSFDEVDILRPVLDRVFVAVLVGMHKAAEWDEKCRMKDYLDIKELNFEEYKRVVYVRESYGEE